MAHNTSSGKRKSLPAVVLLFLISLAVIIAALFLPAGVIQVIVLVVGVFLVGAALAVVFLRPRARDDK